MAKYKRRILLINNFFIHKFLLHLKSKKRILEIVKFWLNLKSERRILQILQVSTCSQILKANIDLYPSSFYYFFKSLNQNMQFCPFSKFFFHIKSKKLSFFELLFTSINYPPTQPETASSSSSFFLSSPSFEFAKNGGSNDQPLPKPIHGWFPYTAPLPGPLGGGYRESWGHLLHGR